MARLEFRNVRKSFGSVSVLQDLCLSIRDGEFAVFVGPSGCGKSTLLRIIAGLETITAGELMIDDVRANEFEPAARGVAMVFQSCALYPHMSVEKNMGFGLSMSGCPAAEVSKRVRYAAELLQIEPLLKRKPSQLSGGQRQRAAIGRAIVRNPKIFLFDEPLSSLDAELRASLRLEIAKLHRRLGATMIYVTHDQAEAMTLADRIVVMRGGNIEQIGRPLELYERPVNSFVGGFIGSPKMNFLDGAVVASPNGRRVRCLSDRFLDVARLPGSLEEGTKVAIGLRPEHFRLSKRADVAFPVTVEFVEHLGAASYAHATTQSGEEIILDLRHIRYAAPGTELTVGVPPEQVHLFSLNGTRLN
jgi:lactose/L-arabinose transport system ATP-binding protein